MVLVTLFLPSPRLKAELAAWEAEAGRLAGAGPKKAIEKARALEVRKGSLSRAFAWCWGERGQERRLVLLLTNQPSHKSNQAAREAQASPHLSPAMRQTVALLEAGAAVKREALAAATELVRFLSCRWLLSWMSSGGRWLQPRPTPRALTPPANATRFFF